MNDPPSSCIPSTSAGPVCSSYFWEGLATSVEKELICPITREVPVDAVVAADGNIYERKEIERWFQKFQETAMVRSPLTNESMPRFLAPCAAWNRIVRMFVEGGMLSEDVSKGWREADVTRRKRSHYRDLAIKGDTTSMVILADMFMHGDGPHFPPDVRRSFYWRKKAADHGDVEALYYCALCLLSGHTDIGMRRNIPQSILYLTIASERGNVSARSLLSHALSSGLYGLQKSEECAGIPFSNPLLWGGSSHHTISGDEEGGSVLEDGTPT